MPDHIFVQTNESSNRVLAFRREADGRLGEASSYPTGGRGDDVPHLPSQGSVVLTRDGKHLLVTNAGGDEVSVFAVGADEPASTGTVSSGGVGPKSVAEHEGLVYVLNAGEPSLEGFRLGNGGLEPLADTRRTLAPEADPAQVGFTPDGSALVVTDRGSNSIVLYSVDGDGTLGEAVSSPSPGPTPYGFAFAGNDALVVTEAFGAEKGKAAVSSYAVRGGQVEVVSASVGNGRSEICWAVATPDGRYVFTTNFADGAVSRYSVAPDGSIVLGDAVAGTAFEGQAGLRDAALTRDGSFLYAIDADAGRVFGWSVTGGELSLVGSWDGLPESVAGLAAS
jgi:6-phosphogluconolactonase